MADVVVTVPKRLWAEWLSEGDLADGGAQPAPWEELAEYGFNLGPGLAVPDINPGERVYVVAHGRLRGYSPLVDVERDSTRFGGRPGTTALVRHGGAVASTIAETVRGFQGWRYRWWDRAAEIPFPDWREAGVG